MQPFTYKSVYTILLGGVTYYLCYWLFNEQSGFEWIVLRSAAFVALFATGMFLLKLTPDALPVLVTMKKKLRLGN